MDLSRVVPPAGSDLAFAESGRVRPMRVGVIPAWLAFGLVSGQRAPFELVAFLTAWQRSSSRLR